jgi:putative alpha-1,2-mannosidase
MMWQMLGLYPVVPQPIYLTGSPWFSNISMHVGHGKFLNISARNLSDESYYVQSLRVNGQNWNQSWVHHDDIKSGGTLEFVLGSFPAMWDVGPIPPSPGHVVTNRTF